MTSPDPLRGARVLVAVEDLAIREFLTDNLTADGCVARPAPDMPAAMRFLTAGVVDAAIIDLNGSTFDALDRVRGDDGLVSRIDPHVPVMVLTSRYSDTLWRMRTYERGADDVLGKPFSYPELRVRLSRLLGRNITRTGTLRVGALVVDPHTRQVRVHNQLVPVTAKEFALLRELAADPTRVLSKETLLRSVWGFRAEGSTRTLDSHACRLRSKLALAGAGRMVINVWGVGYRLVDPVSGPTDSQPREAVAA